MPLFLLLFLIWPLAEIWLMVRIGSQVGALNTVFLVVITAALGLALVQLEWQRLARLMHYRVNQGQSPISLFAETLGVGFAGVLLLIPGFLSDAFGLLLLLPPTRKFLLSHLKKNTQSTTYEQQSYHYYQQRPRRSGQEDTNRRGELLEGEFERKEDPRP